MSERRPPWRWPVLGTIGTSHAATRLRLDQIAALDQPRCNHVLTRGQPLADQPAALAETLAAPNGLVALPQVVAPLAFFRQ